MVNPLIGASLISAGGGILSSILGNNASAEAAKRNAALQNQARQEDIAFRNAGTVDAFGNVLNRVDPATGAPTTTPAPGVKNLLDELLATDTATAGARTRAGDISSGLFDEFANSGFTAEAGFPGDKARTRDIAFRDDERRGKVFDRQFELAESAAQRAGGNTSNLNNLRLGFDERILDQIRIGGETRGLDLFDLETRRQLDRGLGTASSTLADAGGRQVPIPGVADLNQITNSINAIQSPVPQPPDFSGTTLAAGLQQGGRSIQDFIAAERSANERQQLIDILRRQVGNQGEVSTVSQQVP